MGRCYTSARPTSSSAAARSTSCAGRGGGVVLRRLFAVAALFCLAARPLVEEPAGCHEYGVEELKLMPASKVAAFYCTAEDMAEMHGGFAQQWNRMKQSSKEQDEL